MGGNSRSGNSSCISVILAVLFFSGNAFLFSGSLSGDLEGNSIAIIVVLAAVVADIGFIYWIIKSIVKRVDEARKQKKLAKANAVKAEINRIINKYHLSNAPVFSHPLQKVNLVARLYEQTVLNMVESHWKSTATIRKALTELHKQNEAILACPYCSSDKQKLEYLHEKTAELEQQAIEFKDLAIQCGRYQIALPFTDENVVMQLRNALKKARNSRKTKGVENVSIIDSSDPSKLPRELSCFKYGSSILGFTIKQFTFCLFPKVALVFCEGAFFTALNPIELRISVSSIEDDVFFSNGKYNSDIVDTDSKCVQAGIPRRTWLHTCKDGTPDLRYSYNPSSEYRIDNMAYGKVQFEIAGLSALFYFSSYDAIDAIDNAAKQYSVGIHTTPEHHTFIIPPTTISTETSSRLQEKIRLYKSAFSTCTTPEEIIQKYISMNDQATRIKTVEIEILRYYLQHNSAFATSTWTYNKVLRMVETKLGIIRPDKPATQSMHASDNNNNKSPVYNEPFINSVTPSMASDNVQDSPIHIVKTDDTEYHPKHANTIHADNTVKTEYNSEPAIRLAEISKAPLEENLEIKTNSSTDLYFGTFTTEDIIEMPTYRAQKINYGEREDIEQSENKPYPRFEQMRRIKAPCNNDINIDGFSISILGGIGNAAQFAAQARYMADYTDDYSGHADFQCYYPTYSNMNDEQLRTYFTWRSKVRTGQIKRTNLSYAFVYIYELLNLIGVASADEGILQLLVFWSQYRFYEGNIDRYLETWVKEFYVYYKLACSYESLLERFPEGMPETSAAQSEIYQHKYKNKDVYLNQLSSYKYLNSKFYESELGYTLIECIPLVLERVDEYLGEQSISFPTLLLNNITTCNRRQLFSGAVVDIKDPRDSYTVKINAFEEYSFSDGEWRSKCLQCRCYSNFLGYIIKSIEAELRELTGYKRKLQPNIGIITYDAIEDKRALTVINRPEFTALIRNIVKDYFLHSGIRPQAFRVIAQNAEIPIKPAVVTVNLSKLEEIRSIAMKIQNRLVIEEPEGNEINAELEALVEEPNLVVAVSETEQADTIPDGTNEIELSKPQRICISIIISGKSVNPQIMELSKANGTLPEVLMEGINELLFEIFGDNVIDSSADVPYIYDDYLSDVKKLIKED